MDLSKQLNVALEAITAAKDIILDIYKENFSVQLKKDHSVVTIADTTSDATIRKILSAAFPNYGLLSEESIDDTSRTQKEYCWIIDPLDGTMDFVNRTDHFAINIALSFKNEIVLGVISVPVKNILYYAIKGQGSYKIENNETTKIHVSNRIDHLRMLVSQFFFHEHDNYKNMPCIESLINCGSSYKAGLIAEGKAEFCIKSDDKTKEWDTAPMDIIIKEAGGNMTDLYGNIMTYNKEDVVNKKGFIVANNQVVLDKFKKQELSEN